jgi:hypothetical protein
MQQVNRHEVEVLEMLAGEREWESGAWVNACIDFLQDFGYCTRGGVLKITDAGRAALAAARAP